MRRAGHCADRLDGVVDRGRVDEVGHAELLRERSFSGDGVDPDDAAGSRDAGALDDVGADAAEPEHHDGVVLADIIEGRSDTRGDPAAQQADGLKRRVRADAGESDLRNHRVVGERRGPHEVIDGLSVEGEAGSAVGHDTTVASGLDLPAEIGAAVATHLAGPAFRTVEGDDVVTGFQGDPRTHLDDPAFAVCLRSRRNVPAVRAFMATAERLFDAEG